MKRKRICVITAVIVIVAVLTCVVLYSNDSNSQKTENEVLYETVEDAVRGGATEILGSLNLKQNPQIDMWIPLFVYQQAGVYYPVMVVLEEEPDLVCAQSVYVLKIAPCKDQYSVEYLSDICVIAREDAHGAPLSDGTIVMINVKSQAFSFMIGKTTAQKIIPDDEHLLDTNLEEGTAANPLGIYILVYELQENGEQPDIPQFQM